MKQSFTLVTGLALLLGLLVFAVGPASAQDASGLIDIASQDLDPAARTAAADVVSMTWADREAPGGAAAVSADRLFALNGVHPSGTFQGRRLGFETQRSRILSEGDPLIGKPLTAKKTDNSQLYADMALASNAPSVTVERRFVRAVAVVVNIRSGFAIVPGGPAEAFRRIQSCIVDGSLKSNQNNKVSGVSLDCSSEVVRRAVSDFVAGGFYTNFGNLPAVDFTCKDRRKQAENGPTVAARWAAARSYVQSCADQNVKSLTKLAGNAGSMELQFAAVRPLAERLAQTDATAKDHLGHVEQFSDMPRVAMAHAWAAGLHLAQNVKADSNGNPTTPTTGNLRAFSAANLDNQKNEAAVAPFARFFNDQNGLGLGKLTLTISMDVSGAELPLTSSIQTLSQ